MAERRWMLFVDGENLTIRAAAVAAARGIPISEGPHYMKDVFIWMPHKSASYVLTQPAKGNRLEDWAARSHYYTSVVGDPDRILNVRRSLRNLGFQPQVFKRTGSQRKSKGVDVTITKDLLVNAFQNNYDVAVLIAGDGDYVPVIEELKRMGKTVYVVFFLKETEAGFNEELRLSCDKSFDFTHTFFKAWTSPENVTGLSKPMRETTSG